MASDSYLEAILGGVTPHPFNRPKRWTTEFTSGLVITLEGDALIAALAEVGQMYMVFQKMTSGPPAMPSEHIREAFQQQEKKEKDDTNKE